MKFVKSSIFLLVCLLSRLQASEAFYAISSLRFYVDDQEVKSIHFEESDVARLWKKAALNPAVSPKIEIARSFYYSNENFNRISGLLEEAWDQIFESHFSQTCDDEGGYFFYPHFSDNPLMDEKIRQLIKPYLLPLNHEMKPILDEIFSQSRAIENDKAFANAGFKTISNYMRVARHPLLSGYLLKVFLDDERRLKQEKRPGWLRLVDRCEGALFVRKLIKKEKIKHFVVPDKLIYPLPVEPAPKFFENREQQLAVLLVTDMELVPHEQCREAWKNKITPQHLDELYLIISHGYASTYLAANVAYTKKGTFACIDTEFPQRKLHFEKVRHYLSNEMCEYWDALVRSGGKLPN
jgi:hypothetical protein